MTQRLDNVADEHREAFERVFADTQRYMMRRMMDAGLPNSYTETVAARMIAFRAAVADDSLDAVALRVVESAAAFECLCAAHLGQMREQSRRLKQQKKQGQH